MKTSVLCANYNNARYLDDFFKSLVTSTQPPDQIIFVDDKSIDNSIDIANSYVGVLNIEIIQLKKNIGFANALNVGLVRCNGEYIIRIDPDDMVAPTRIEKQVEFLDKHPEFCAVGSQAEYFLSDTRKKLNSTNMPTEEQEILNAYYRGDNGLLHGTITIRNSVMCGHKYIQAEVPSEDYGIFLRILNSGVRYMNLNEPLTLVRVHSTSVSNDLKIDAIRKILEIRKSILNLNYSTIFLYRNYLSLRFYRKFLFEKTNTKKALYIFLACIFAPDRLIRRLRAVK